MYIHLYIYVYINEVMAGEQGGEAALCVYTLL